MDARLLCEACGEAVTAVRLSCLLPLVKRYWEPPCGAGEALSLARGRMRGREANTAAA